MKKETKIWLDIVEEDLKDMIIMRKAKRYRGKYFLPNKQLRKL